MFETPSSGAAVSRRHPTGPLAEQCRDHWQVLESRGRPSAPNRKESWVASQANVQLKENFLVTVPTGVGFGQSPVALTAKSRSQSYTLGMKIAVSIPDALFEKAERLRRQERRSRSNVFAAALTEYVARHAPDEVTEAMNRVCADVNTAPDDFVQTASRRILEQSEW